MNRYQLIKPYLGINIYESHSLKGGAKKCYNELKTSPFSKSIDFEIRNLDNMEIYKFKVKQNNMIGGNLINPDISMELKLINNKLDMIIKHDKHNKHDKHDKCFIM